MAMQLGKDGHEHAENMKRIITLDNGTTLTMAEIQTLIDENGEDNIPYLNSFAKDAFFAGDTSKLTQLVETLKE